MCCDSELEELCHVINRTWSRHLLYCHKSFCLDWSISFMSRLNEISGGFTEAILKLRSFLFVSSDVHSGVHTWKLRIKFFPIQRDVKRVVCTMYVWVFQEVGSWNSFEFKVTSTTRTPSGKYQQSETRQTSIAEPEQLLSFSPLLYA